LLKSGQQLPIPSSLGELARTQDAVVHVAEIRRDDRSSLVAVKFPNLVNSEQLEAIFRARESGRLLKQLKHQHIVAPIDVGSLAGNLCLITEFVDGVDLLEWLEVLTEAQVKMPTSVVLEILRATSSALDAALTRPIIGREEPLGITHRDLKPTNIMVDRYGDIKVIDFRSGLTSLQGRQAKSRLLQTGSVRYQSPGRRAGKRTTPSDDIYALGIIGIELFRGRWLRRLRSDNPAHDRYFSQLVATLDNVQFNSAEADNIIRALLLRMVAFDPDARPTAEQVCRICRRLAPAADGPVLSEFAEKRAVPILPPLPPRSALIMPIRIYPEQPLDLPEIEHSLFGEVSEPVVQWQETEAGWIQISDPLSDDISDLERVADATEAALRSIRPTAVVSEEPHTSSGDPSKAQPSRLTPTQMLRVALVLALFGSATLAISVLILVWGVF
jgi:serine/threonine protein kinase